jgi:GntR family transcriptional regulator, negative regulator for fad regulon and positive regulator of fabA
MPENENNIPMRPAQFTRHRILVRILNGAYPPGTSLPNERSLAEELGVTRPTLRETLQRFAAEGWITIHQGKSTIVGDYWKKGGLSILGTLAQYGEYLPPDFIVHLLELRKVLMPAVARAAAIRSPGALLKFLEQFPRVPCEPEPTARYDWELQEVMALESGNRIYPLILNDFVTLFQALAPIYFTLPETMKASREYYAQLQEALPAGPDAVEAVVYRTMVESIEFWQRLQQG